MVEERELRASDGVRLCASYFAPDRTPPVGCVVFLHKFASTKEEYADLAKELSLNGFACIAVDSRGHGKSAELNGRAYAEFSDSDFRDMRFDAAAAYDFMHERFAGAPVFLVGASIGANTALNYASSNKSVKGAALFSPGRLYKGVTTMDSAASYGKRPLFAASSSEDSYSYESTKDLCIAAEGSGAQVTLYLLDGAGHGVRMLGFDGLKAKLIDWLSRNSRG